MKKNIFKDLLPVAVGEGAVALAVCLVAYLLGLAGVVSFDYRIITGAILGAVVMIANYAWLIFRWTTRLRASLTSAEETR